MKYNDCITIGKKCNIQVRDLLVPGPELHVSTISTVSIIICPIIMIIMMIIMIIIMIMSR